MVRVKERGKSEEESNEERRIDSWGKNDENVRGRGGR
jgi:hypothetical protein